MNKAILVIDMPRNCSECPICEIWEAIPSCEEYYCNVAKSDNVDQYKRPDWCPLREFPKRMINFGGDDDYADGYNDCLDKILRGSV